MGTLPINTVSALILAYVAVISTATPIMPVPVLRIPVIPIPVVRVPITPVCTISVLVSPIPIIMPSPLILLTVPILPVLSVRH